MPTSACARRRIPRTLLPRWAKRNTPARPRPLIGWRRSVRRCRASRWPGEHMEVSVRVAFLGMGRMGSAMARHVLTGGHELVVWNRTRGKAADLLAAGATEADSPAAAARDADAVVLMLRGPDDAREVLLGESGVTAGPGAADGALVINATTVDPDTARSLAAEVAAHGLRYVDAPVAGSVQPATDGTLRVLVGAAEADYADAEPLLGLWGAPDVAHPAYAVGSALKLVINLTLGVAISGVGEALRLAADVGVDRTEAMDALATGPFGWTLAQKRPMLEAQDYTPVAFSLDLLAKDLGLCVGATTAELPATAAALAVAHAAIAAGHVDDDYASLAGFLAFEGNPNSH